MTEETLTDLAVTEGDDLNRIVTEELEVALEDKENNECSSVPAIQDSGRIMFRGKDMLFLKVNGIQMFTFYEIMHKLCPDTKRGNYSFIFYYCYFSCCYYRTLTVKVGFLLFGQDGWMNF